MVGIGLWDCFCCNMEEHFSVSALSSTYFWGQVVNGIALCLVLGFHDSQICKALFTGPTEFSTIAFQMGLAWRHSHGTREATSMVSLGMLRRRQIPQWFSTWLQHFWLRLIGNLWRCEELFCNGFTHFCWIISIAIWALFSFTSFFVLSSTCIPTLLILIVFSRNVNNNFCCFNT